MKEQYAQNKEQFIHSDHSFNELSNHSEKKKKKSLRKKYKKREKQEISENPQKRRRGPKIRATLKQSERKYEEWRRQKQQLKDMRMEYFSLIEKAQHILPVLYEQNVQMIRKNDSEGNRIRIVFEEYLVERWLTRAVQNKQNISKKSQSQEKCYKEQQSLIIPQNLPNPQQYQNIYDNETSSQRIKIDRYCEFIKNVDIKKKQLYKMIQELRLSIQKWKNIRIGEYPKNKNQQEKPDIKELGQVNAKLKPQYYNFHQISHQDSLQKIQNYFNIESAVQDKNINQLKALNQKNIKLFISNLKIYYLSLLQQRKIWKFSLLNDEHVLLIEFKGQQMNKTKKVYACEQSLQSDRRALEEKIRSLHKNILNSYILAENFQSCQCQKLITLMTIKLSQIRFYKDSIASLLEYTQQQRKSNKKRGFHEQLPLPFIIFQSQRLRQLKIQDNNIKNNVKISRKKYFQLLELCQQYGILNALLKQKVLFDQGNSITLQKEIQSSRRKLDQEILKIRKCETILYNNQCHKEIRKIYISGLQRYKDKQTASKFSFYKHQEAQKYIESIRKQQLVIKYFRKFVQKMQLYLSQYSKNQQLCKKQQFTPLPILKCIAKEQQSYPIVKQQAMFSQHSQTYRIFGSQIIQKYGYSFQSGNVSQIKQQEMEKQQQNEQECNIEQNKFFVSNQMK